MSDLCHASFRKSTPKYARFYTSGVLLDPRDISRHGPSGGMSLPWSPSGPSFWRGLKCACGGRAAFIVWDQATCGDCWRALLAAHNGKLPWKEPRA